MPPRKLIVALDGPAGAGKSTVSKLLAQRLGFALVDTGAIYRCIALMAARARIAFNDDSGLEPLATAVRVRFDMRGGVNHVYLGDEDVTEAIRTPANSLAASQVSARPVVRARLLELQRRLAIDAPQPGAVLEGRDIGTVVFPDADLKVFMDASVEARAQRRHQELRDKGQVVPLEKVLAEIVERDEQDSKRAAAPLKKAADARSVDSTAMTPQEIVDEIVAWVDGLKAADSAE